MIFQSLYSSLIPAIQNHAHSSPLLIGVTGPMGIGKTYFSQGLKDFLLLQNLNKTVSIIHTDGFLYPNHILLKNDLMKCKGFPSSFDQNTYEDFIFRLLYEEPKDRTIPVYDQNIKDIHPQEFQHISASDIYIIEGINLFFSFEGFPLYKNLYHLLVLLCMDPHDIYKQYINRFNKVWQNSKQQNIPYFDNLKDYQDHQIKDYQNHIWQTIHLPFKAQYIDPYKDYATHILEVPHLSEISDEQNL